MKLSTKGRYGLRALIDLAEYGENEAVSVISISERQNISESYLEQLFRLLKKAGLITSTRGAGGGYRLARAPEEITVGEILKILEGGIEPVSCSALSGDGTCETADLCVTRHVWKRLNEAIEKTLGSMTLSELAEESKRVHEAAAKGDPVPDEKTESGGQINGRQV